MLNNDIEIDILSPELRKELGDSNDVVIIGRKEKRDRDKQREDRANEEFLEEAKQLSKKAKKKLMIIQEKKEKDLKRDSYYEILKQNEISNEHRQLLSNTREANTMKNLLKKILKKYQAGLTLTIEEKNLLFPNGEEQADNTNTLPNTIDTMKEKNIVSDKINNDISINQDMNDSKDLLFDMNDIYETSDRRQENKSPDKKKKKKNKKSKLNDDIKSNDNDNDQSITTGAAKPSGFGSQLMMQFQKLKENNALKVSAAKEQPEIIVNVESNTSSNVTDPSPTDASNSSASIVVMTQSKRIAMKGMKEEEKFIAKEEPLPVTNMGQLKVKDSTKNINMTRTKFLIVKRNEELRAARMLLPVCGMEQEIVEKIMENDVVILCGETGSGKSTQVPQFLYEAGFGYDGIIGITQPRRVAAVSTASRVAFELGGTCEDGKTGIVGYQIRFDSSTIGPETAIKFMTDGILLREITTDFLLRKYSSIILDEAHERNTNTDVLLGMLSRAIHIRRAQSVEENEKWSALTEKEKEEYEKPIKPLKLIIMSATMRIEDFQNPVLFKSPPPIVRVEARQHPVVTHFSKRTELRDYLDEVHRKVCQIHRKLPDGGVLVFLTGKREILHMVRKLSKSLNGKSARLKSHHNGKDGEGNVDENEVNIRSLDDDDDNDDNISIEDDDTSSENSDISYEEEKQEINNIDEDIENDEEKIDEDVQKQRERMLREVLGFDFSEKMKEIESKKENVGEEKEEVAPPKKAYVLPLYAMMPAHEQRKVFLPPPPDSRLIVLATNVAETSITIPGIRYVVDCGRQKERVYENTSGISKFEVKWISKAAAEQRKGRAGRTGPGHCYRLYSSAFFDQHMSLYQVPEISRIPLDELVLSMRSMGIVEIENFPFPTPPPKVSLTRSLRLLEDIGAIPRQKKLSSALVDTSRSKNGKNLTSLGQLLAKFPINPRYSKMLVVAKQLGVITHALSLVAILSEKSPFLDRVSSTSKKRKKADDSDDSDDDNDENENEYDPKKAGLWFHPDGDALARLRALGAYIFTCKKSKSKQKKNGDNGDDGDDNNDSESVRRFCVSQNIHQATLERSFQIRQQIASLCPKLFADTDHSDFSMSSAPPTKDEEASLRQVLTSGSCDCIAKKVPINVLKGLSRRKRLTAYFSCNSQVTEPIYVHPSSALYRNNPSDTMPEFVTYNQLISNEEGDTTYMTCVTAISPTWIPIQLLECSYLKWGAPLESPQPFYDLNEDCVACYVVPKYGMHKWELPPVKRDLNELCNHYDNDNDNDNDEQYISKPIGYRKKDEAYRWFARLLLEGSIGLDLKGALRSDKLKEPSTILTKQIPNVKAAAILRLLVLNKILTKTKLLVKLKDDPLFLSEEIQQFLSAENRKEFRKSWSNLT